MSTTVWVPRDAGALALGAEAVAKRIASEAKAAGADVKVRRNGSRGLYWLEPLVEVETAGGRVAYGPVTEADVKGLVAAGLFSGGAHALALGPVERHPWLASQQRLTFARAGRIDPLDLGAYRASGGYRGLARALEIGAEATVAEVLESGLRGRGGAAFPTGIKWQTVLRQPPGRKYVTCNADEGDSGTFSDRMLMEGDPFSLIEGMTIAGVAVGATRGYIYLRVEYPHAAAVLKEAIAAARAAGCLGPDVLGSGKAFELEVRLGAGAYICGEETSMLESLEGRRGEIRVRPPLPAEKGLFGAPTIVNNVITLATVPTILADGAAAYKEFGQARSRGTIPLQLAGNVRRGGLVERAFGLTIRELLEDYGGGTMSGRPARAVQIGGPLGAYVPASQFDLPLEYEALAAAGAMLGHGGVVVFDDTVNMLDMARYAMEFCAIESCGKCTPCRIGSTRGAEALAAIGRGEDRERHIGLVEELCDTMIQASLCGLGGMTPFPVQSALKHFPEDFGLRTRGG
ncbi:MAG TPA: NADH-ubiquinone oxidoreductase-F iron-sulfur binding region domain-containing protein [Steroidobacteraceae bacterium]|nr:NADH-ubiquinone oxidoreductase-F iron-sulfur binding region domain-containing protein [Steroidobacteraceae bacterium]